MWYNLQPILSHNCLFNFVIGNRGSGKTYGAKKWAIKSFLKNGDKFIYLRRYKTEFDEFSKFFADISDEFPDHELSVKGKNLLIDGKVCGYGIALSTALQKKSTSYHDVNKIIFDEFVIDSKVIHYMHNEVTAFLEFVETVFRTRDNNCRVLFLSNSISIVNPYFLYWNLNPNPNKKFNKYQHMIIENVKNQEFIDFKYSTRFGQIIKDTKYGKYAVENEYLKDNSNFVEKKTGNAYYRFSVVYNGATYGVWVDYKKGLVYLSEDIDPCYPLTFVLTDEDHSPNLMLIKTRKKSSMISQLTEAYEKGYLRFESMKIKNQGIEMIKLLY